MMQETLLRIPGLSRRLFASTQRPGLPGKETQGKGGPVPTSQADFLYFLFASFFFLMSQDAMVHCKGKQTLIGTTHESAGLAGAAPCGSVWHASARQFFTLRTPTLLASWQTGGWSDASLLLA